jgi:hypothetical protein
MTKKRAVLIVLFVLLNMGNIFAQIAGINFTLGFPRGEFQEKLDKTGFGGSLQFYLWEPTYNRPFSIGANVGYMIYGMESRNEPFSYTIPDVTVNVSRTNNIVNYHLLFMISPFEGPIRPYIEGLFGGAYFFTETKIKSQGGNYEDVASSVNFNDNTWSYGGGGGLMMRILKLNDPEIRGLDEIMLDLKVRYLVGGEAEYLKEGSVILYNGRAYYDVVKSKTDLLTAHLGVVILFSLF